MAVPAAVALVRQVQGIVESPELLENNDCLDQVSSFLDCLVDHPDSRARVGAARALAQLSARLSSKERACLDLQHATRVLARLQNGSADGDDKELQSLLAVVLGGDTAQERQTSPANVDKVLRPTAELLRLRVCVPVEEKVRDAIRQTLVQASGVLSVTFETDQIVVGARTPDLVQDPVFVEAICTAVEAQMPRRDDFNGGQVVVVSDAHRVYPAVIDADTASISDDEPLYLDDEDEEDDAEIADAGAACAASSPRATEDEPDEPAFFDDSEDEAEELNKASSQTCSLSTGFGTSWSFFSHTGFFSAQRLREYEDDPRLVSRLRRAHLRLERRRQEDQMRLRQVLSVITPLRTGRRRSLSMESMAGAVYESDRIE